MSMRGLCLVCSLALVGLSATSSLAADDARRPNIAIFISDDHGRLDSTVFGNSEVATPNMQRIAAAGMTMTRAFVASPTCAPSRAALLTGKMPLANGAMLNHQPPRPDVKKWPAYFQELGYEVVAFGKVAHYKQGKDYGFDRIEHDTFHDPEAVTSGIEYLKSRPKGGKPLCILIGTNWPHVPWPEDASTAKAAGYQLPPTHVDTPLTRKYRAQYYAAVERMDADLGAAYDAIGETLGPDTLFVHFSDHGAQWPFGKWNLYDAGIAVPMIAVWPGRIAPASSSSAMVSLVDMLPTLLELAGGEPPTDIAGKSFAGVLLGEKTDHRQRIFTTHSADINFNNYPMRSVRTERWKYIRNLRPEAVFSCHLDRAKPVDGSSYFASWVRRAESDPSAAAVVARYRRRPAEELYDLASDPYELTNLAADPKHADTLSQLRADLARWMEEQGDAGLEAEEAAAAEFLGPDRKRPSDILPAK